MSFAEDLTGKRFGRLMVLHRYEGPSSDTRWVCRCDCGGTTKSFKQALRKGVAQSCGCLRRELSSVRAKKGDYRRTHGMSKGTPEYGIWCTMRRRCDNPNTEKYPQYGGRGIKVCERWNSFESFYADMGPRPSFMHSIERKNNEGHYEPSNCIWATAEEQSYNKTTTRLLEYRGRQITTLEASRVAGIPKANIFSRLYNGWSVERAIEEPLRRKPT